jgi:hypothetical protein
MSDMQEEEKKKDLPYFLIFLDFFDRMFSEPLKAAWNASSRLTFAEKVVLLPHNEGSCAEPRRVYGRPGWGGGTGPDAEGQESEEVVS